MSTYSYADAYLKELEAEIPATRKCLERIPESLFGWKPHERSMTLGYLALLVAGLLFLLKTMKLILLLSNIFSRQIPQNS